MEEGRETGLILFEIVQISTFGVSKRRMLPHPKEQVSPCVAVDQARRGWARRVNKEKHKISLAMPLHAAR